MTTKETNRPAISSAPVEQNIRAIADMEREARRARSLSDRIGGAINNAAGSMGFAFANAAWYLIWIAVNAGWLPIVEPFDPYPFTFLTLMVSLEAIFLSVFVLMAQTHMSRQADARSHLDLQINLLAEEEMTKVLQILQRISDHLGLETEASKAEIREMTQKTQIETLVRELHEKIPED